MQSIPKNIFEIGSKRLIFITGKGGIGKSLMAASLAKKYSSSGKKVLLIEQSATDHLGPLLGSFNIGHEPTETSPHLWLMNMTAGSNFHDFVVKHLKKGALFEALASNKIVHSFFGAIPGFGELMLLGRLFYTLNLAEDKPDLVIVDSYASGHFLSLMTTPGAVLDSGLSGPIKNETLRVKEFLSDASQVGIIFVGVLEELVMSEIVDFIPKLIEKSPTKVCSLVFNRVLIQDSKEGASKFLADRLQLQKNARRFWDLKKSELKLLGEIPTFLMPDLGFIDEPLTSEVVDRLLEEQVRI